MSRPIGPTRCDSKATDHGRMFKLRFMLRPPTSIETPVFVFELLPVVSFRWCCLRCCTRAARSRCGKRPTVANPVAGLTVSPMYRADCRCRWTTKSPSVAWRSSRRAGQTRSWSSRSAAKREAARRKARRPSADPRQIRQPHDIRAGRVFRRLKRRWRNSGQRGIRAAINQLVEIVRTIELKLIAVVVHHRKTSGISQIGSEHLPRARQTLVGICGGIGNDRGRHDSNQRDHQQHFHEGETGGWRRSFHGESCCLSSDTTTLSLPERNSAFCSFSSATMALSCSIDLGPLLDGIGKRLAGLAVFRPGRRRRPIQA